MTRTRSATCSRGAGDDAEHLLYREEACPYIHPQLTCQARGRPDTAYQRWRWQPHDCTLPAFDAVRVLEALRGKRMLYVGDSLGRGQFASMVCLLQSAIPDDAAGASKSFEMSADQQHTVFTAREYKATVEFYMAPFLLESNSDNAAVHRISERMVRRGSIGYHSRHWEGVDVIVFNTYLWWCTGLRFRILYVYARTLVHLQWIIILNIYFLCDSIGKLKQKERAVGGRRQGDGVGVGVDGGGVRHGVPGHAAVGQGQHGLQHHQGLLHQHVAHAPEVTTYMHGCRFHIYIISSGSCSRVELLVCTSVHRTGARTRATRRAATATTRRR